MQDKKTRELLDQRKLGKATPQNRAKSVPNWQVLGPEKVFPRICLPKNLAKFGWPFWWILAKTLYFMCKTSESFRKFLGSLRMILCYWKTFSAPKGLGPLRQPKSLRKLAFFVSCPPIPKGPPTLNLINSAVKQRGREDKGPPDIAPKSFS